MDPTVSSIVLVPLLAVAAPLLATAVGRVAKIPLVVFEIVLGLLVGPSVLGWVPKTDGRGCARELRPGVPLLHGRQRDRLRRDQRRRLRRASLTAGSSRSSSASCSASCSRATSSRGVYIGIALTSTALGTLMPVLRDAGELPTPFGRAVTAVGAVGEFGPLLAISLFLSGRKPLAAALVLIGFARDRRRWRSGSPRAAAHRALPPAGPRDAAHQRSVRRAVRRAGHRRAGRTEHRPRPGHAARRVRRRRALPHPAGRCRASGRALRSRASWRPSRSASSCRSSSSTRASGST